MNAATIHNSVQQTAQCTRNFGLHCAIAFKSLCVGSIGWIAFRATNLEWSATAFGVNTTRFLAEIQHVAVNLLDLGPIVNGFATFVTQVDAILQAAAIMTICLFAGWLARMPIQSDGNEGAARLVVGPPAMEFLRRSPASVTAVGVIRDLFRGGKA